MMPLRIFARTRSNCEPCRPRAAQHPHEDRLRLVVRMVREDDGPRPDPIGHPAERPVPRLAGSRLGRGSTEREPFDFERNRILYGSFAHSRRDGSAVLADSVIDVRDDEIEGMVVRGRHEQVEERQRIRTARDGHQRPPRRRRELEEMATESVDQRHTPT